MRNFDFEKYFFSLDIKLHVAGEKNVTKGWVNIECPFCDDTSWHLGINIKSHIFNCYRCTRKGHLSYLIAKLEKISYKKAKLKYKQYSDFLYDDFEINQKEIRSVELPSMIYDQPMSLHKKYIKSRGFSNDETLIKKYKLKFGHTAGKYRFSIIAPIFMQKKIVSYISADCTRKRLSKYMKCPNEKSIINNPIYNVDNINCNKIVIVEGLIDCWKFGDNCIATLSSNVSKDQIKQIIDAKVKECFIIFDSENESLKMAEQLNIELSPFISSQVIELNNHKDLGEMNLKEIKILKKQLGFNYA